MKNILISIFTGAILSLSFSNCSTAQSTSGNGTSIKEKIDTKNYTFVAQSVTPMRGGNRYLTSSYDVYIKGDSLVAYLPYFGRATTAPINPTEGGIKFTSTNFSYDVSQPKKSRWEVIIKPKDNPGVQELQFSIFDNGSASLQVLSTSRDPISFEGKIK